MRDVAPTERTAQINSRPTLSQPGPSAQPVTPPPPPAASPAVQLASSLSGLQETGTLEAVVEGFDSQGRLILRTEAGSFAVATQLDLKAGERLLLQLIGGATDLRANILRAGERLLTPAPNVTLQALGQSSGATLGQAAATVDPAVIFGPGISAGPAAGKSGAGLPASPANPALLPTLTPGSPSVAGGQIVTATLAPALPSASPATRTGQAPPHLALPTGSILTLMIEKTFPVLLVGGITSTSAANFPAQPAVLNQSFPAVVGAPNGGMASLQTPFGVLTLALAANAAPAAGSRINFQITKIQMPPVAVPPPNEPAQDALLRLRQDWPALRQAMALLQAIEPQLAGNILDRTLPQADARLGATALFLLAALKGKSISSWLGDETVRILRENGRSALVQHLNDDFLQLGRLAEERGPADWRVVVLPIFDGRELRQAAIYYRNNKKDGAEEQDSGTRFVVEIELSAVGSLQFDGLVRTRRFDLILRSERAILEKWQSDIGEIFYGALAIGGLSGNLTFQAGGRHAFQPLEEILAQAGKGGVSA